MTTDQAPCRFCGVAAPGPFTRRYTRPSTPFLDYLVGVGVGVGDACRSLDPDAPGAAVRAALRIVSKGEADADLATRVFLDADLDVGALMYDARVRPEPQRRRWAHVVAISGAAMASRARRSGTSASRRGRCRPRSRAGRSTRELVRRHRPGRPGGGAGRRRARELDRGRRRRRTFRLVRVPGGWHLSGDLAIAFGRRRRGPAGKR